MRFVLGIALFLTASGPVLAQVVPPLWSDEQLADVRRWADAAPQDALPRPDTSALDSAMARGDSSAASHAARQLALSLGRLHLHGMTGSAGRAGWSIADDGRSGMETALDRALAGGGSLDPFFAGLRPAWPDYEALRAAFARETDAAKRTTLARNMERWRWMPRAQPATYLLVNAAAFEVQFWRSGRRVGVWPVIVGKVASPTPVFATRVTGVTFNPWWELPPGIAAEMRGKLSARRGYVFSDGRWRQRPGRNNSLGAMKLAMQNPWNVYLHDTPSKNLFARPVRAFSHGCVRVGDALGFAATLLDGVRTRAQIDRTVATRVTTTINLPASIPVYLTYFTVAAKPDGTVAWYPDVYSRDTRIAPPPMPNDRCGV